MIAYREITEDDAASLLHWRRRRRVAQWQLSEVSDDIERQRNWIRMSRKKPDSYHWIQQYQGVDIGHVNFNSYDPVRGVAVIGNYVGPDELVRLHMAFLKDFMVSLIMRLNLKEINSTIIDGNTIEKIMDYLGFEADPTRSSELLPDSRLVRPFRLDCEKFLRKFPVKKAALLPMTLWEHSKGIPSFS